MKLSKTALRLWLILSVVFFISCNHKGSEDAPLSAELVPPLGLIFSAPNGEITVFSLTTNEVLDTLLLDGWSMAAAVSRTGDRLFCANNAAGSIEFYRLPSFSFHGSVLFTGSPRDLYTNASSSIVYFITANANFWSYSLSSESFDTLGVGLGPRRMCLSPIDNMTAWVACPGSRTVHKINLQSFQKLDTLTFLDAPTDLQFSADGNRVYIAFKNPGYIKVLDLISNQFTDSLQAGQGPFDLAISNSGRYLAASDSARARVRVWDLPQNIYWDLAVGNRPGRVRFVHDSERFYIVSAGLNRIFDIFIDDSGPHIQDTIQAASDIEELALWEIY